MPISRNNSNFLFCPQLSSLFPPLRQVAPPAQKFVDERPLFTVPRPKRQSLLYLLAPLLKWSSNPFSPSLTFWKIMHPRTKELR
jgi:hypothetical protein